jgi:hypothetical protein
LQSQSGLTLVREISVAIKDTVSTLQTSVETIRDVQTNEQRRVALDWLSPTDFTAQQHDIIKRREAGTGQWLIESAEFMRWEKGHDKTLFCCGMPGAGKTMIAAIAIDHISTTAPTDKVGLAYVFCNYKSEGDQSALGLLSALLRQLVEGRPDLASLAGGYVQLAYEAKDKDTAIT